MTADSRIEALEKQVADQREQINGLIQMFIRSAGASAVYHAVVDSLLVVASTNEPLDKELNRRLFNLEAVTIGSAQTEEEMEGFEEAREAITEARTHATAN